MWLFKKKEPEKVIYLGPRYKKFIKISFHNVAGSTKLEILSYSIEDGFLILILPNLDLRCVNVSTIWTFDIIREEIPDEKARADS